MRDARLLLPACAFAAALLSACFTEPDRHSGVDDFPNSIYARVSGFMDESKKADSLGAPPADSIVIKTPPISLPGAVAKAAAPLARLAKPAAGPDSAPPCSATVAWDSTGTDSAGVRTQTTLVVCIESFPKFVKSMKLVVTYPNGRVETTEGTDADGDGVVNIMSPASKVRLVITAEENGIKEQSVLIMGGGPDKDFDTEPDNLMYSAAWVKTRGSDTLASAVYSDADGDSVAVDNGKPSTVRLVLYSKEPNKDDPEAVWSRMTLVMTVRYKVEAKEIRGFKVESESKNGRRNTAVVLNRQGGEEIDQQDTLEAHFLAVGTAPADTVDTLRTTLVLNLGQDFDSDADDSLFEIHVRAKKKLGEEKSAAFDFVSERAIPHGKDPENGKVKMRVDYTDDTFIEVDGTFKDKALEATVTDRAGNRFRIAWNAAGKVLVYSRL